MAQQSLPSTMKAMEFNAVKGGLEKNLTLNPAAPLPKRKSNQHLIQVIAATLNPADYKVVEIPLVKYLFVSKHTVPCNDIVARIVQPADGSPLKPGQIVFGAAGTAPVGAALAEYAVAAKGSVAPLPEGVDPVWGSTVCVAGLTAYQSIVPYVKDGSSVFINGGSGGTGVFAIQIAKAKGCYVTTTCSTPNVELCKSLGADEVIDYKTQDVIESLKASGRKFDHVVDNVGTPEVYWKCHEYTVPGAKYMAIGGRFTGYFIKQAIAMRTLPGFLGGGKRKCQGFMMVPKVDDLAQVGVWMKEGKVKPVIDSRFKLEEAAKAFEKLRTDRARGKIVVEIAPEVSKTS